MFSKIKWEYVIFVIVMILGIAVLCQTSVTSSQGSQMEFPPTLVINLDSRQDRMREFTTEFRNWPVTVERVSAIKYSPGWKGCSASHLKCVKIAKERKYPWVLIVEDDCTLSADAAEKFQELLPFLWANRDRWDIFYGGVTSIKKYERISYSPAIFQVYCFAAHFCLIHSDSYNKILNNHPWAIEDYKDPIDVYYAESLRIWTTAPFIAKQRPSKSDRETGVKDYTEFIGRAEKKLLNMK